MSYRYNSEKSPTEYANEYEKLDNKNQNKTIMNPGHVDEAKWEKAKKISHESYGEIRWPFVHWLYERLMK